MWLLVERSDDVKRLVFGKLDSQPIVIDDIHLGQDLAVSYDNIREHQFGSTEKTWEIVLHRMSEDG